ncbi:hypothetical protein GH733_010758 [Mirounga leonina]|nr:hypothetical protein GH733_010758 [Mirounga leonina]
MRQFLECAQNQEEVDERDDAADWVPDECWEVTSTEDRSMFILTKKEQKPVILATGASGPEFPKICLICK